MTTKIHTRTDALSNTIGFYLTGGIAHDLCGSDELPDTTISNIWLADRAYDADAQVLNPLTKAEITILSVSLNFAYRAGSALLI